MCERVQLSLLGPVADYSVNFQKALLESVKFQRTAMAMTWKVKEALKEVRPVIRVILLNERYNVFMYYTNRDWLLMPMLNKVLNE